LGCGATKEEEKEEEWFECVVGGVRVLLEMGDSETRNM
jgi:hypothetical protein